MRSPSRCHARAHSRFSSLGKRNSTFAGALTDIRCRIFRSCAPKWFFSPPRAFPTTKSLLASTPVAKSSACGGSASSRIASPVWKSVLARVAPGRFPPDLVVQIKALACELPSTFDLPLSRWSAGDIARQVRHSGLVASISGSTVWRWLHQDAIRPWYHRGWIFPRDPRFAAKANRILDRQTTQNRRIRHLR